MVRAMYGVHLKNRNKFKNLMEVLDLNEVIVQLGMANVIRRYGRVLRGMGIS